MSLLRRVAPYALISIVTIGFAHGASAETQTSPNYINENPSVLPAAQVNITSANYQILGSLEPMVGNGQSASYITQVGVPFQPPAAAPVVSGGGTPSGGSIPLPYGVTSATDASIPLPTLKLREYTFKSTQTIFGTRPGAAYQVVINGSTEGVTYPDQTSWQRVFPLFLGINDVLAASRISTGATSLPVRGQIERLLIGDVNRNHVVDDADLSLFTRAWHSYTFFADFNEDGVTDDADLSLLASHWKHSF